MPSYTPAEWSLLGTAKAGEHWTFAADLGWAKWSKFVSPYGTGNINTYVITNPTNAGFRDRPVGKIGVDYSQAKSGWIRKLSYRAGYSYQPSPVPDQTGDSNFVDNNRHSFTAGLGFTVVNSLVGNDLIDIDTFFQYNWLVRRQITKDLPTNVGAPGYLAGGKILLYGLGASFKF
jgi:long-subunit fatty acid transport protein